MIPSATKVKTKTQVQVEKQKALHRQMEEADAPPKEYGRLDTTGEYEVWVDLVSRIHAGQRWTGVIGLGLIPGSGLFQEFGERLFTPAKTLQWWSMVDLPGGRLRYGQPDITILAVRNCRTYFGAPFLGGITEEYVLPDQGVEVCEANPRIGRLMNELAWSRLTSAFEFRRKAPEGVPSWHDRQKDFLKFIRSRGPGFVARDRFDGSPPEATLLLGRDAAVTPSVVLRPKSPTYLMAVQASDEQILSRLWDGGELPDSVMWGALNAFRDGQLDVHAPCTGTCVGIDEVRRKKEVPVVDVHFVDEFGRRHCMAVSRMAELTLSPGDKVKAGEVVGVEIGSTGGGRLTWAGLVAHVGRRRAYQLVEQWIVRSMLTLGTTARLLDFGVFGASFVNTPMAIPDGGVYEVTALADYWSDVSECFVLPPISQKNAFGFESVVGQTMCDFATSRDREFSDRHVWYADQV